MSGVRGHGGLIIGIRVEVRDPCPIHGHGVWKTRVIRIARWPFFVIKRQFEVPKCACEKPLVGVYDNPNDLGTTNFTGLTICNIFDTATASSGVEMKDTSGSTHTAVGPNAATSAINLALGDGVSAVAPADYAIQTSYAWGTVAASVGTAITVAGSTSYYTITGTFTNSSGSNQTAGNVGLEVTCGGNVYLVSHDNINSLTGYVVSPSGTVAVIYTVTVS
jgi:hypothetical protein